MRLLQKKCLQKLKKEIELLSEILTNALSYLGITVANIANTFDPDMIVIGGGVVNGGEIVLETIKQEVENRCLRSISSHCKIEKAMLDGKAGMLGAAALAILETK